MHLLKPFTGTGSVFFPIGLPPEGTCEFATPECLKHCYMDDDSDFDEETRVTVEETKEIYTLVTKLPLNTVIRYFVKDLDGLQTPILSWFGAGDCPTKDVDRISTLVQAMPKNIVQMGFTRNRELWSRHRDVFALTIEQEALALGPCAMYSIPDYKEQMSIMYSPAYQVRGGFCGPTLCRDRDRRRPELTHYINCRTCHRLKTGCFDRR